ncbi:MAG TPA: trypsin-like peptidase domain-containing protein [Pirellulales bacterium]|jgi:S1-C subfamily serine protease|nr:trypsin-like peptidase domain-containing protein [Pirellulales bacterium]
MSVRPFAAVSSLVFLSLAAVATAEDTTRDSVVHITVSHRQPNMLQPWTKMPAQEASGTGFVIEGRRIMTNYHVIQYANQIYVQPHRSADKLPAKLFAFAPAIDLALLELKDDSFFDARPPLPMAEGLPPVKGPVNVYGYPLGGQQMSVTEGIISRVDFAPYGVQAVGLMVQIDAALNPGNSGGPAVSDGQVIGVAFSMNQAAENVGYVIPCDEIRMFLADVADGKYDGKPHLFGMYQTVENEALRAKLGLPKGAGGLMVTQPAQTSQSYPLTAGDVITHMGEVAIDADGRVKASADLQLSFQYLVPKLAREGKLALTRFRAGQSEPVEVPVAASQPQLVPYLNGAYPRYLIHGPMVFSTATKESIMQGGAMRIWQQLFSGIGNSPLLGRLADPPAFEGEELVIVPSPLFTHPIAKGYSHPTGCVVTHVNGTAVKNLVHLVELLRDCQDEFVEFRFDRQPMETLVFRRTELAAATEEILTDNGIRKPCSDDLRDVWERK